MNRLAAVIAMFVLFVSSVAPFEQKAVTLPLKDLVTKHDHAALIEKLTALKSTDPKQFIARDYDYLLARAAESEGKAALAIVNYHSVANRQSVLRVFALAHLARIARSTGNQALEQIYLKEIIILSDDENFIAAAKHRIARNTVESGNYKEAIRLLASGSNISGKPSKATVRENRVLLGEAYRLSGDVGQAKKIFDDILNNTPKADQPDDAALAAVKNLDAIDGSDASLGEAEHWRRANIYQFNRYFAEAKFHFETVFAANHEGANAADSLFQIGRGFAQKENFVEALAWYERVIEQFPTSAIAKDALLQAAAAYSRVGKQKEAITRYHNFIDRFPTDEKLERAYLNIVDIRRDLGDDTDALKWCATTEQVFKGKVPEALAVFAEARIYLSKDDWQNALAKLDRLKTFSDLGGANVPGGTTKAEVNFLRAFILERQQRYAEAIDTYISIPDGRGEYYGWRSSQSLKRLSANNEVKSLIENRLALLTNDLKSKGVEVRLSSAQNILRLTDDQKTRELALNVLKSTLREIPNYKIPAMSVNARTSLTDAQKRLLELGLTEEALPNKVTDDLADSEARWRKVPADFPIELIPREHLQMLYPAPFADELLQHATTRGVDPRFMLAIMRQESRFQNDARSVSAARGLMQFIHTTTTRVANEFGREFFTDDEVYDPETSILFGAHYLADLFIMFPEKREAVSAAYNGGETNVKRWLARVNSSEPERYMSEIIFGQSKDYAEKVMANYRMYQYLYDERLVLKPTPHSE